MPQQIKYIHVGLGKTATTTLQKKVFPKLCDFLEYEYLGGYSTQILKHRIKLGLNRKPTKLNLPKKVFISCEALHSWDPFYREEYAKKNLIAFGSNSNIILTLREPKSYLTSVYVQQIHGGEIISPNQFFLNSETYSERLNTPKFAVEKFSYNELIDTYLKKFKTVTIQKYETIDQLNFINSLFDIKDDELSELKQLFNSNITNRRFSKKAVNLTIKLNKLLNDLGYSILPTTYKSHIFYINQECQLAKPGEMKKDDLEVNDLQKIRKFIAKHLKWGYFMRHGFDKIVPYKKYELDFGKLPYINIDELIKEYNQLPKIYTYKK